MATPYRTIEEYELEGDAREAYVEWFKDMEGVVIIASESVEIDDFKPEHQPF